MTYEELSNLMLEVWIVAGVENATIEDVEKDRKQPSIFQKCSVCRGKNQRKYIWYLEDEENGRQACMDLITRQFLTTEQIAEVFGLNEEKTEMSQEMNNAINIIFQEIPTWKMTPKEKHQFTLAQQGNRGALCDLLASLGMASDNRFVGFFAEQN